MHNNKTAVVTGASSGIGRAICTQLLDQGFRVVGMARKPRLPALSHPDYRFIALDLARLDTVPAAVEAVVAEYPAVDAVVCAAGRGRFGSLEEFSYRQIRELMDLNFTSQAYVARAFLPAMKARGRGDVVFIGSEAALSGGRRGAVYSAGKFALRGFAQALREECGKTGVRVSIVNPGMVRTGFFDALDFTHGDDASNYVLPEDVAQAVSVIVNARPGTVFDEINLSPLRHVVKFKKN